MTGESWAENHARENPGHRAKEGLDDPGSCDDCPERSPIYNLVKPRKVGKPSYTQAMLPGTGTRLMPAAVWVDVCTLCGVTVMHRDVHDEWHVSRPEGGQ